MNREAPSNLNFKVDQTFFGFNASDRKALHNILFDLIWAGEGRWDWNTVYTMPVFLRKFWINKVNEKLQPEPKPTSNVSRGPVTSKK